VDFGDIRAYPPDEYPGIIVLRMTRQDTLHILAAIRRILPLPATGEREPGRFFWLFGDSCG
jgi:hypothetical protein